MTQAQTGAKADVVAAISNLENDAVKGDLAGAMPECPASLRSS
jgi:hypothetical protein